MSRRITIRGTVRYINLATGFWAIIGDDGREYRPVNMPEQLKMEGAIIKCAAQEIDEDMSIFMWGIPVRISSFHTTVK